ncbi:MAG: hypothetical protein AAGM22_27615 [Acidobacteriota bacterium]
MPAITLDLEPFKPFLPTRAASDLLRSCLDTTPELPDRGRCGATPWDPESRRIERLKQYRPREAAELADRWLEDTLDAVRREPDDPENIGLFASALSTWSGLRRTLGQLDDSVLATHHALRILSPQPTSTRAGFACQRAAFVLGDLGETEAGRRFARRAVSIHCETPAGPATQHVAVAYAGVGAFQLFYCREFAQARFSFGQAQHPGAEEWVAVGARHGLAYSYLMEGSFPEARNVVDCIRALHPSLAADQDFRLRWLEAEIAAGSGEVEKALALYDELFMRSIEVTELAGGVLVFLDAASLLVDRHTGAGEWWGWRRRLLTLYRELTHPEQLALDPCLDALRGLELDRELLDRTAVAFKKASNRMLLRMGRPGAAGRPELGGDLEVA